MKTFFVLALLSSLLSAGCGGETPGGNDGGGGSSTTSSTTDGTSTTGTTGTNACAGLLNGTPCATCMEDQCCDEMTACLADPECADCLMQGGLCLNELYEAAVQCGKTVCPAECSHVPCDAPDNSGSDGGCVVAGINIQCDPFTNAGCGPGEKCQTYYQNGFFCMGAQAETPICAPCDESQGLGPICEPGMVCHLGACTRLCCDDSECGSGFCETGKLGIPNVGYCVYEPTVAPCKGLADGVCDPDEETCACDDCKPTALCNADQCTTDGICDVQDSCTCPDCDRAATCGCNYDGVCDSFSEWCKCPDCWSEAGCADNPKEKCQDDGACGQTEFCACVDCKDTGPCLNPNYCTNDGTCVAYEGCICADCASEPACQ